jgi:glucokinase
MAIKTGSIKSSPQEKFGILADIGATNARFALADEQRGIHKEKVLKCEDYTGLSQAVSAYLELAQPDMKIIAGSFAIAGPVKGDSFSMTNHPWSFSVSQLKDELGYDMIHILNDFHATALAIPDLKDDDLNVVLKGKHKDKSAKGVIGPGTGLGVANIFWNGKQYSAVPGEGGHVTMPARTQREFDIFDSLLDAKYSHISAERVCSGKGLVNLYNGIKRLDNKEDLPELEPAQISKNALNHSCEVCEEALDLMMAFLGRVAGNLALTLGAFGGIYITGGIVPKLGDYFENSRFKDEFCSKGRFTDYMDDIPVYVVLDKYPAFHGLYIDLMNS